jgi:hypothetical protein
VLSHLHAEFTGKLAMPVESTMEMPAIRDPRSIFHIFEVLPTGMRVRCESVAGLETAFHALDARAKRTRNECLAVCAATQQVVAQRNTPLAAPHHRGRLFQVAYTRVLGFRRAEELLRHGFRPVTVIGNEQARRVLSVSSERYLLFILGHNALAATREEMVHWIRSRYAGARILALNGPHERLSSADFNAPVNEPHIWMQQVQLALAQGNDTEGGAIGRG